MSVAGTVGWGWRLRRVTAGELGMIAEAQVVLLSCQLAKWRRPIGKLIEWNAGGDGTGVNDWRAVERVAWAVTRAGRYGVFRPKCLVRSLAIQRMLRRRGIAASTLNIGVRMQDGSFQAHAWVELSGAVVGDTLQHVQTFAKVTDFRLVEL
jgi:hypothetical protein